MKNDPAAIQSLPSEDSQVNLVSLSFCQHDGSSENDKDISSFQFLLSTASPDV